MTDSARVRFGIAASIVAILMTLPVGSLISWRSHDRADLSFVAIMVLIVAAILLAGFAATGRWLGVLADERGKFSLSRLQMTLWTVVVMGSVMAAALSNLAISPDQALEFTIPMELWALLGISTTTLVSAGLIKQMNASQGRLHSFATDPSQAGAQSAQRAGLIDLVSGEQFGNRKLLDLGKLQALIFSVLVVAIYAAAVFRQFHDASELITKLPALNSGFIALLGISHAGYLTAKAVPSPSSATQMVGIPSTETAVAQGVAQPAAVVEPQPIGDTRTPGV